MGVIESIIVFLSLIGSLYGNYVQSGTVGELEAREEIYVEQLKQCGANKNRDTVRERKAEDGANEITNVARKAIAQQTNIIRYIKIDSDKCFNLLRPERRKVLLEQNKTIRTINQSIKRASEQLN